MKHLLLKFAVVGMLIGVLLPITPLQTVSAATFGDKDDKECSASFLTFPAWYRGLERDGDCNIQSPTDGEIGSFVFIIILNIIEMVLQIVAYAAVGYVIYGGFKYLTAAGDPSRITAGRKIITNALIGLVLSMMSVAIVNLVVGNLNGPTGATLGDTTLNGIPRIEAEGAIGGILTTVYYAAGIVAVIVIIVSAFFYVTSQGDPSKTKRGKDGILYSVVGLVIVIIAFLITNFIIGSF